MPGNGEIIALNKAWLPKGAGYQPIALRSVLPNTSSKSCQSNMRNGAPLPPLSSSLTRRGTPRGTTPRRRSKLWWAQQGELWYHQLEALACACAAAECWLTRRLEWVLSSTNERGLFSASQSDTPASMLPLLLREYYLPDNGDARVPCQPWKLSSQRAPAATSSMSW